MTGYNRELIERERKLINEISKMKFSFKKLVKTMELDALISSANR